MSVPRVRHRQECLCHHRQERLCHGHLGSVFMRETPRWFLLVGGTLATLMMPTTPNAAGRAAPAAATQPSGPPATSPATAAYQAYQQTNQRTIRFLEDRLRRDPDDIISLNRLAGLYLQRAR